MRKLFENIDHIAANCKNVAVLFSGGRDSIVMLDLFMRRAPSAVGSVVFMYLCPGLEFQERLLRYYESRYKIQITRIAHPDVNGLINTRKKGRRLKIADAEKRIRQEFGSEWVAYGFQKIESLQRRGQLSQADRGIDWKYRKLFPIAEWNKKHTQAWISKSKLVLPPEYGFGYRDIATFKGAALIYIRNNYPDDFKRIVKMYPDAQGEYMRAIDEQKRGEDGSY